MDRQPRALPWAVEFWPFRPPEQCVLALAFKLCRVTPHARRLIVHVLRAELALDGELQDQLAQFRDAVRGFSEGRELLAEGFGGHGRTLFGGGEVQTNGKLKLNAITDGHVCGYWISSREHCGFQTAACKLESNMPTSCLMAVTCV